jgi:hypothetical protein
MTTAGPAARFEALACEYRDRDAGGEREGSGMLYTIISILFVLWLIGFLMHIGGGLIHILLVAAVIVFLYNLITGRRAAI